MRKLFSAFSNAADVGLLMWAYTALNLFIHIGVVVAAVGTGATAGAAVLPRFSAHDADARVLDCCCCCAVSFTLTQAHHAFYLHSSRTLSRSLSLSPYLFDLFHLNCVLLSRKCC